MSKPVRTECTLLIKKMADHASRMDHAILAARDLACSVEKSGVKDDPNTADKVNTIVDEIRYFIEDVQNEYLAMGSALEKLREGMVNEGEGGGVSRIDYQQLLRQKRQELQSNGDFVENQRNRASENMLVTKRKIWAIHHPGELMAGEDEDSVIVVRGEQSLLCPISMGKLEDPVKGKCGHTFSRESILGLIGTKPYAKCAVPGCGRNVTMAELVDDVEMRRAVEKDQRQADKKPNKDDDDDGVDLTQPVDFSENSQPPVIKAERTRKRR